MKQMKFGGMTAATIFLALSGCGGSKEGAAEKAENEVASPAEGSTDVEQSASAMPSALSEYGDFRGIPANWSEHTDPIDGPGKFLAYLAKSSPVGTFLVGCERGEFVVAAQQSTTETPLDAPMRISIKIDQEAPFQHDFMMKAGETQMKPGDGSPVASAKFADMLANHSKLVMRVETMMGSPINEPAMTFDLKGLSDIRHNLQLACALSSAKS